MRTLGGIRDFVEHLRGQGELLTISTPLDPKFEISTVLSEMGKRETPAVLVEKVKGYPLLVVGNILGTKKRLSMVFGVDQEHLAEEVLPKLEKKIPPILVTDRSSKEMVTEKGKIDLTKLLRILTHYVNDSGPYITSAIASVRDPRNSTIGRGLHRMELRGKDQLGISLLNPPLSDIYSVYKGEKKKMEIAAVIGADPLVFIASIFKVPYGMDKLCLAGGIAGEPIPVVKAKMTDIDIPAHTEIVIEGFIDPMSEEKDGMLGESSGYYMTFPKSPSIHVTAITYRKEAFFQAIIPWSLEVDHILSLIHGIDFIPKMKREILSLQKIHLIPKTFGSHAVMSIDTDNKGEIRRALTLALSFPMIKKAIAVGSDVDPEDNRDVEWSLATRFQPDRDIVLRILNGPETPICREIDIPLLQPLFYIGMMWQVFNGRC